MSLRIYSRKLFLNTAACRIPEILFIPSNLFARSLRIGVVEAQEAVAEVEDGDGAVGLEAGAEFVDFVAAAGEDACGDEAVELFAGGVAVDVEDGGDLAYGRVAFAFGQVHEDVPALPASEHGVEVGALEGGGCGRRGCGGHGSVSVLSGSVPVSGLNLNHIVSSPLIFR